MPHYEQLNEYERQQIAIMRTNGKSYKAIGAKLGRRGSTIFREHQRNREADGQYFPGHAHCRAMDRRSIARRPRKIVGKVAKRVKKGLKELWSPEQIGGRGALNKQDNFSFMSIYRALETAEFKDYKKFLRGPTSKRRKDKKRPRIHDRVMIDERPAHVEKREKVGDWEGDTVRSSKASSYCVMTLVDRCSQFLVADLLEDWTAAALNRSAIRSMKHLPFETLSVDNGMEFASHKQLAEQTGVAVYFAHPKCPWERGLNEQVNGLLRHYFPKGTDFSQVTPAELRKAVKQINNRPRKTLGYRTPYEVMQSMGIALAK